ncbi:MAG: hypothetical protein VYD90_12995 [Pseudomonadota bacterium]|nr:hypothetical protein [Pseudomonadota bacterium]
MSDEEFHTDHDLIMQLIGAHVRMATVLSRALEDAGVIEAERFADLLHSEDNIVLRATAQALSRSGPNLSLIRGGADNDDHTPPSPSPPPGKS